MFDSIVAFLEQPAPRALATLLLSFVVAFLGEHLLVRVFARLAAKTATTLDDLVINSLRRPIFYSVIFIGTRYAMTHVDLTAEVERSIIASLQTLAIVVWTGALMRVGSAALRTASYHAKPTSVVQPRTLPLFDILLKVMLLGSATYAVMLAWHVDVSAWLASAGVVGLAVGFAAKDSLANLFAGIFIIADSPYKLGDFIQFEDGLRGRVTDIGLRSTRILTRDDIEINVPNSIIGNAKVVNETGGPYTKERIAVPVSVAYGSDVERVRAVLLSTPVGAPHVVDDPTPTVYFNAFGASGLEFAVMVWIDDPAMKDVATSEMNFRIYKALQAAGIEIPYSKHDIYIKELPGSGAAAGPAAPPSEPAPGSAAPARAASLFAARGG